MVQGVSGILALDRTADLGTPGQKLRAAFHSWELILERDVSGMVRLE